MYFSVQYTLNTIKKLIKEKHGEEYQDAIFKVKGLRPRKICYPTFSRHVQQLENHNKLKRVGGNNRDGFDYQVASWEENNDKVKQYNKLIDQIKEL